MNHLPDDTASSPTTAECSVTTRGLPVYGTWYVMLTALPVYGTRYVMLTALPVYGIRYVMLTALLKIFELFQETFTSICILSDLSGRSVSVIAGSNLPGGMDVCFECSVLSGRGLCVGMITRPEDSYRLWCV